MRLTLHEDSVATKRSCDTCGAGGFNATGETGAGLGAGKGEVEWDSETRRGRVGRRLRKKGQRWGRKEQRKGREGIESGRGVNSRGKERDQGKGAGGCLT